MVSKTVNTIIWVVLFLLLFPSSLAVASWNSLPGSRLFQVKLVMEQGLVFIVPSAQAKGDLQIAYTSRRLSEAKQLITSGSSVQGLSYLDNQVNVTKQAILATRDPVVKRQLAQKYVASLRDVSSQLEEQKQIAVASAPEIRETDTAVYVPPPTPTSTPYVPPPGGLSQGTYPTTRPTYEPTPTPFLPYPTTHKFTKIEIVESLGSSKENIDDAIEEIENDSSWQGNDGNNNGNNGNNNGGNGNNNQGQGQGQGNQQGGNDH